MRSSSAPDMAASKPAVAESLQEDEDCSWSHRALGSEEWRHTVCWLPPGAGAKQGGPICLDLLGSAPLTSWQGALHYCLNSKLAGTTDLLARDILCTQAVAVVQRLLESAANQA